MSDVLKRYLEKLIHDHRRIDARGVMQVNRMIELTLDEVFIDLTVRMGKAERGETHQFLGLTVWRGSADEPAPPNSGLTVWKGSADEEHDLRRERYVTPQVETGISSAELWQRHAAWVLLGDPGAGKTTLLKHYALQNARAFLATPQPFALSESKGDSPLHGSTSSPRTGDAEAFLPILIPLRFLAAEWAQQSWQAKDAVLNYLANEGLREMGFEDSTERTALFAEFKNALTNGRALLLFDGLDEQHDANIQRNTVQAIESVLQTYPKSRCLVSSRIIGYDAAPLGAGFHTATLEPFNDEQMAKFFQQWIYAVEQQEDIDPDENTQKRAKEKADDLIAQIQANAGIRTLAANPLLCTIIGLIRRQGATLPTIRVELYKLCIDTFIFNWELQKRRRADQQNSLDKDQTQAVLEEIALHLHERCADNRASHEQLAQVICEFLVKEKGLNSTDAAHKAEQLLNLIRDVSGLLIDRGNAEYGFFHLTFQEYLTARAITRRRKDIDRYLGKHLFEPRWREVIRLAAAHQGMKDAETGSEFIAAIRRHPHPREAIMHYAFRMAFLCLKETKVELDTSDEMMREWVRIYLVQLDLRSLMNRLMAQQGLDIRYREGAIQPLLAALMDEDGDTRLSAANALGNIKDPAALSALIDALKDKDSNVRYSVVYALGNIKDPAAFSALLDALKNGDSDTRSSAADALGRRKDTAALPALIDALKDDDRDTRCSTADALGMLKNPNTLFALIDALKDKNEFVRISVANALGNLKDTRTLTALLVTLKDKHEFCRAGAASALGTFNNPVVLSALLDALNDEEYIVRSSAAEALRNFKEPVVLAALLDAIKDKDSAVRSSAAQALGSFQETTALAALLVAINDEDFFVRMSAADTLGNFKDPTALTALLNTLNDQVSYVRSNIVEALAKFKDCAVLDALISTLKDEDHYVRSIAAKVLGNFKDPITISSMIDALKDEESLVRYHATLSLGNLKDPATLCALLGLFKDKDNYVRSSAAEAIEQIDLGSPLCPN